jgi:hypothetical protein
LHLDAIFGGIRNMNEADGQVADLAEGQFGVFARRQAAELGLSEFAMTRRVMSGRWQEMFPAVYRLPGTTPTGRQRAMAAVLWAGSTAAVSHTTATRLLRLDGARSVPLHLTVGPKVGVRAEQVTLHRSDLPRGDVVSVDGIRCTSATRTIIDCAAMLDDESLEAAFEQARVRPHPGAEPRAAAEPQPSLAGASGRVRVRRLRAPRFTPGVEARSRAASLRSRRRVGGSCT